MSTPWANWAGVSTAQPNKCPHPNAIVSWQVPQNRCTPKSFEHNKKKEKE
jgi:hypothetical protein